jgi:hypothetical protein
VGFTACPLFWWKKGGTSPADFSINHNKVDFGKVEYMSGGFPHCSCVIYGPLKAHFFHPPIECIGL